MLTPVYFNVPAEGGGVLVAAQAPVVVVELVDTEALDLDSLGIRWGQRSTVELRDIGLRLEVR